MSTINHGKPVPKNYRSLANLPEVIDKIDADSPCSTADGDLKKDEVLCWLDNFHYEKSPAITPDDIAHAANQSGVSIFLKLSRQQKIDLVRYFAGIFPDFPPYQENPHRKNAVTPPVPSGTNGLPRVTEAPAAQEAPPTRFESKKGSKEEDIKNILEIAKRAKEEPPPAEMPEWMYENPQIAGYLREVCKEGLRAQAEGKDPSQAMARKMVEDVVGGSSPVADIDFSFSCDALEKAK